MSDEPKALAARIQDNIDWMYGEVAILKSICLVREKLQAEMQTKLDSAERKLKALQAAVEKQLSQLPIVYGFLELSDALAKSKE